METGFMILDHPSPTTLQFCDVHEHQTYVILLVVVNYRYGLKQNDISIISPHVHITHKCLYSMYFSYQNLHQLPYVESRETCPAVVVDSLFLLSLLAFFAKK